jgi:hypothetical protein
VDETKRELNLCSSMMTLFKNKNWMLMTLVFFLLYGNYCAVGAVVNSISTPYGFDI